MASVGAVTRQIAALEISNKTSAANSNSNGGNGTARPLSHIKQPSQSNVAKLLTKYGAPNPYASKPTHPSSLRNPLNDATSSTQSRTVQPSQSQAAIGSTHSGLDIGNYDGGLELEYEKRGEKVFGEAAQDLALDSSVAQ